MAKVSRREYLLHPDAYAKRGNDLPHSKLDPDKVREIRTNRSGKTAKQIAEIHGVHFRTIEKILYFETWKHVI